MTLPPKKNDKRFAFLVTREGRAVGVVYANRINEARAEAKSINPDYHVVGKGCPLYFKIKKERS